MQKFQNIYDNEDFFNEYKALRERKDNYNVLLEQPAMAELLPDLKGKTVLDLGCGYGQNCIDFINRGSKSVVGVDISQRMLEVARSEKSNENITYLNMCMTNIDKLNNTFDFIYSSLAFHYIEDFDAFCKKIFSVLNNGGTLLFSQEHPITTASVEVDCQYNKSLTGKFKSFTFSNYGEVGLRKCDWFVGGVEKYHRRLSDVINALINAGFTVTNVVEPMPSKEAIKIRPSLLEKEKIRPTFLIVKAKK